MSIGDTVVAHPGDDGVFGTGDDIRDGWLMVQIEDEGTFGNVYVFVPLSLICGCARLRAVRLHTKHSEPECRPKPCI